MVDVELTIDDVQVTAPEGASVLDAARRAGVDIPALCHHEAVPAIASCRLCLMEGHRPGPRLGAADDLMRLSGVGRSRRGDGLGAHPQAPRHESGAPAAARPGGPEPPAARPSQLGVTEPRFAPVTDAALPDCILCELCVRVCSALG